ncbi:MAG: hypothetical protein ACREOJ_00315 [Gemmatimonadaceae bacterium]
MKKKSSKSAVAPGERDADEILPEYDAELLRRGVRGKYVQRFREGTNIVVLEPDVAAAFPDSETVNAALRALLEIARRQAHSKSPAA